MVISRSFLPLSKIEKLLYEKSLLHVSHDFKWSLIAEDELPCSFTLVAKCLMVLPI